MRKRKSRLLSNPARLLGDNPYIYSDHRHFKAVAAFWRAVKQAQAQEKRTEKKKVLKHLLTTRLLMR